MLLSAVPNPVAQPAGAPIPPSSGTSSPTGYSPAQIKGAYGLSNVTIGGVTGDGAGQTIAIISAYDDPDFVDSTSSTFDSSDLHKFDVATGLPDPPSFTKVDEDGGTDYPTSNSGWADETALDVEWTHAMAPDANILLVEAYSDDLSDLIEGAMQYVDSVPAVSVVNMSFTVGEFAGETSYDSYLQTPDNHQGITVLAASGDSGEANLYPSASPDVVSVGSTTLQVSGDDYQSETGYSGSGGGISPYEGKPSFQSSVTQSQVSRTTPDVSIDGDPTTGVSVYDSFNGGDSTPWFKVGGSSAATVLWSGMMAVVDQDRVSLGYSTLNGATQTLPGLYSLPDSDFHDITTGNNGYAAAAGYDLVTGLGTPVANSLVPALAAVNPTVAPQATKLSFDQEPSAATTGDDISPPITVDVDQSNGSTLTTDHSAVTLSISGGGSIDGTTTVDAVNGVATFGEISIPNAGTYKLVATDGSLSSATSTTFTVSAPVPVLVPSQLAFSTQPVQETAGVRVSSAIVVQVQDDSGAVVTTDDAAVTLAIANGPSGGAVDGVATVNAAGGVATFNDVSFSQPGTYQLVATSGTLASATSVSFTVVPMPPVASKLSFSTQPTPVIAGSAFSPPIVVDVVDSAGAVVTTDDSAVTLAIADSTAGATLGGTATVDAVDGVATFSDVTISAAGTFTLSATDGSLTPADSNSFSVAPVYVPPVASKLVFVQQPVATTAGVGISSAVTVDLDDSSGAVVATDDSAVTLSIANGPSGATLSGTVTVNAADGVATFTGITPSAAGTYTLTAADGSLTPATSAAFTVTPPGTLTPTILADKLPASAVAGSKIRGSVTVDITNAATNLSSGPVVTEVFAQGATGSPVLIGTTTTKKLKLAAGKSARISVPVSQIPATLQGSYSVSAKVIDTAGNPAATTAGAALAVLPAYVALAPAVTKLPVPADVVAGSKTSVSATVKITNSGTIASTGNTTVGIYASTDGSISSAVLVNSVTKKLSIKPGGSATVSVPLKAYPAAGATYQLVAEVTDPTSATTTANSGLSVAVAPAFVSFQATGAAVTPAVVRPGKSATFEVTLENTGNVPATGQATVTIGLSATDSAAGSVPVTTITQTATVAVDKPRVLRLKFTIPAGAASGSYFPVLTYLQAGESTQVVAGTAIEVG